MQLDAPLPSTQPREVLILAARVIQLWLVGASAVGLWKSWDFCSSCGFLVLNVHRGQRAS